MSLRSYSEDVRELSPRMRDVLRAAAGGRTELETAVELGVSRGTVKSIRAAALVRLEARNVVEAVALAIKRGDL